MLFASSRRKFLELLGAGLSVGIAGCVSDLSDDSGDDSEESGTTMTEGTTVAPAAVSDSDARIRALRAEEEFISENLRTAACVEEWGTSETTAETNAEVTERTVDGVYVEIQHAYWATTDTSELDGVTSATYVVTKESTDRISGRGVSHC